MTTYRWTDAANTNNWNDAANWSPAGGPPGIGDIASFSALNSTIAGNATVGAIQALTATSLQFTGAIDVLGVAAAGNAGVQIGGNAQLAFTTGASLTVANTLEIGLAGGRSSLSMQGAALTTRTTVIGAAKGSEGTLGITNSFWQNSRAVVVGQSGSGDLSVGAHGTLRIGTSQPAAGKLVLGLRSGATGVLSITDGGYVTTTSDVWIGGRPGAASHGIGLVSIATGGDLFASGTIALAAGSVATLADGYVNGADLNVAAAASISGSGSIAATDTIENNGTIEAIGNLAVDGGIEGDGGLTIAAGATLLLQGQVFAQSAVSFAGPSGTLNLGQFPTVVAPIEGFGAGDTIVAAFADHISFNATTDILTLYTGQQQDAQLTLTGNYAGASFHDNYHDGAGYITVTLPQHG